MQRARLEADCWAAPKRVYRLLSNKRFNHLRVYKGLYRIAQATVTREQPNYLVVALDPVNFEKPYTQALEGLSTVYKSTPSNLEGKKLLELTLCGGHW